MADNGLQIQNTPNIIIITDSDQNSVTVTQPVTNVITVNTIGPQGAVGPQGPSGSLLPSQSGSFSITGSLTVSGSGTFTNIGPAIFSGSTIFTQGGVTGSFTGSFKGDGSQLTGIVSSKWTGSNPISRNSDVEITGSLTVTNVLTASAAVITGNVQVLGTASINTLVVNQTQLSTGSNQLGDAANDFQTLYGTVTIPTGSLTVSGSVTITGSALSLQGGSFSGSGANLFNIPSSGITGLNLSQIATGSVSASVSTGTGSFSVTSGSTNLLFVSSSGNVGIGTNTPSYNLDISTPTGSTALFRVINPGAGGSVHRGGGILVIMSNTQVTGGRTKIQEYDTAGYGPTNYIEFVSGNGGLTTEGSTYVSGFYEVGLGVGGTKRLSATTSGISVIGTFNVSGISKFASNVEITGSATNSLLVKGSGTTNATNALLIQDSGGNSNIQVLDDHSVTFTGTGGPNQTIWKWQNATGTRTVTIGGSNLDLTVPYVINAGSLSVASGNITIGSVSTTTIRGFNQATLDLNGDNVLLYSRTGTASPIRILSGNGGATSKGTVYISDYSNLSTTVNSSAALQVDSLVQGFLPPRTNLTSNISSPAQGLQTYLTGSTNEGLYYYNSGSYQAWTRVLNDSGSQNITGNLNVTGSVAITASASTSSAALLVYKSGSTVVSVQGSQGSLMSVEDSLTGSLMSVGNISGLPLMEVFDDGTMNMGKFNVYPIKIVSTGSLAVITGSFTGSFIGTVTGTSTTSSYALTASYVNPLVQNVTITGSTFISSSNSTQLLVGNNVLFVSSSNDVYIGDVTSSKVAKLTIKGNDNSASGLGFVVYNSSTSTNSYSAFKLYAGDNAAEGQFYVDGLGGSMVVRTYSNHPMIFGTNQTERMRIFAAGNVGIGTGATDSGAKLTVKGSGTTSATTALLVQNANTSASLAILDNGYVGIGIATPSSSLDVRGQVNINNPAFAGKNLNIGGNIGLYGNTVGIYNGDGSTGITWGTTNIDFTNWIGYNSSYIFSFTYSGGLLIRDTTSGTRNTAAKLQVDSTGSGFLQPRLTTTQRDAISTPPTGLSIYNTSLGTTDTYDGVTWQRFGKQTYISGSAGTGSALTVYKSGSTVMSIQGSQGELFSITDSLSGSLFSVSNVSGLPIVEVFSDNTTLIGNYQAPALITTQIVTANSGSTVIYSIPTSSYDGAFFDYTIKSGSTARVGSIISTWMSTTASFTEISASSIGDTSGFLFGVIVSGSNMVLTGSVSTSGWAVKTIIRSI